jgi:nucleotide-binding universal stress UspA family protein
MREAGLQVRDRRFRRFGQDKPGWIVSDAMQDMRALGLEAESTILVGSPAREIVTAAKRMQSDMIVMGHRHLSWFDRMLHPSICWDVLEHSDCPVLVSMAEN